MPRQNQHKEWLDRYGHCKSLQDVVKAACKRVNFTDTTLTALKDKWPSAVDKGRQNKRESK